MGWEHLVSLVSGGIAAPILGYFKGRSDHAHEEEMARIARDAAKEAAEAGLEQAQETTRATEIEKRMEAFLAAIQAEKSITGTHAWVADVRALFRPALTVGLLVLYARSPGLQDISLMVHAAVGFWLGIDVQSAAKPSWTPTQGNVWGFKSKPKQPAPVH